MQLRDFLVKRTLAGEFGQVKIVYPKPISFTVQKVETVSFLPFAPAGTRRTDAYPEVIVESRMRDIVEYLVHLWMGRKIYEIFGLSRLAEFAARYVHLEESVQKLKDLDKKVKLEYFRVRHELVDRTMRELFAGRAIYGKQW
jgi:F0F1-type ATP synthase gamma subunit